MARSTEPIRRRWQSTPLTDSRNPPLHDDLSVSISVDDSVAQQPVPKPSSVPGNRPSQHGIDHLTGPLPMTITWNAMVRAMSNRPQIQFTASNECPPNDGWFRPNLIVLGQRLGFRRKCIVQDPPRHTIRREQQSSSKSLVMPSWSMNGNACTNLALLEASERSFR